MSMGSVVQRLGLYTILVLPLDISLALPLPCGTAGKPLLKESSSNQSVIGQPFGLFASLPDPKHWVFSAHRNTSIFNNLSPHTVSFK